MGECLPCKLVNHDWNSYINLKGTKEQKKWLAISFLKPLDRKTLL